MNLNPKTTAMNTQTKQRMVFALLMGIVTTGIISFTLIGINMGFIEGFLKIWIRSWATAYAVVIPAIVFVRSHRPVNCKQDRQVAQRDFIILQSCHE